MEFLNDLWYLVPLLFAAGVIDGIAGGGGIIALPAYIATGMPAHSAYACNKLQSGFGTACSFCKYAKEGFFDLKIALVALPFTVLASLLSTKVILSLDSELIKMIIAVCMPIVVVLMFAKRKISSKSERKSEINFRNVCLAALSGILLGAYDGLFGPGGGTVAMIVYSIFLNYDLRVGGGNGKFVVVVSNFTAMINYIIKGHMIFYIAIPCALSNMLGSYMGAAAVVKKGDKIVLPTMILVVGVLVVQTVFNFIN